MAPSWFDDQLCEAGARYFTDQGVDVIAATPSGPVGGPGTINPEKTYHCVKKLIASTGAKSVLIAGNGQRAIGAIDRLEKDLGITVLTANQVLLWASMRSSTLRSQITNYGSLFSHASGI